jgi:GT2 family glycosyltransferase
MKTLVAILQYNTHELTDSLYNTLKPYEEDIYDLVVIDNGSDKDKTSQYATYALEENGYYGGGLNAALGLIINSDQYDSIMVLNNDILCHGKDYVKVLRQEMFDNDFMIVSPCVLEPHTGNQTLWKPMRPWHTGVTRLAPFVDYQAPLLRKEFVEEIYPFSEQLKYGWGQDHLSGIVCKNKNWKIGVCDKVPIIHLISQTIEQNPETLSNVNSLAEKNMFEYFQKENLFNEFISIRNQSMNYEI